jgi:esterase/lipase
MALIIQLQNQPAGSEVLLESASKAFKTIEKKFQSLKMGSHYTPLIKSLIQLASSQNLADQGIVNRIIDLITELKNDLAQSRTDADADEAAAQKAYEDFMAAMEAAFIELNQKLDNLTADLAATNAEIDRQNKIIYDQTIIRDDNIALREALKNWCIEQSTIYMDETA